MRRKRRFHHSKLCKGAFHEVVRLVTYVERELFAETIDENCSGSAIVDVEDTRSYD